MRILPYRGRNNVIEGVLLTFFDLTNWSELKPTVGADRLLAGSTLEVTQMFSGQLSPEQCHHQFLECCRRARGDGLDPEVKQHWIQLAEAWRLAAQQAEAFERAEKLARRQK
jgi:hypothetical protein